MYKRILILFGFVMFMFCASFLSLDSISNKNKFRDAAISQQSFKLKISDVRGTIYDCRNIPLVNEEKKFIAAVIPCLESLTALTSVVPEGKKDELYKKRMEFFDKKLPKIGNNTVFPNNNITSNNKTTSKE